jgi:hypothetical protein
MRPAVSVEVIFSGGSDSTNAAALVDEIIDAEQHGWSCTSVSSYSVTAQGSKNRVPISAILPVGHGSCDDPLHPEPGQNSPIPAPVLILLNAHVDSTTKYVVSLVGLPSGRTVASTAQAFSSATTYSVSIVPQGVPGESLTNGKTRDVGQLSVSFGLPFVGRSPVFVNTKDLFSTDSKDSNSAFAVTGGVERGLFRTWYSPVQLSEIIQGNQTAASLSAVSNLSVSGLVPWYWTRKALNNGWIDAGLTPEFSVAAKYTHRFAQQVTAKTPLLSENDASVNPVLTIEPFYLFPDYCKTYRGWIKSKAPDSTSSTSRQFCLGLQIDIGTWYLPLDKTKSGSQQVEGYGDVSILIPLSNLNFEKFKLVEKDSLLNSQLRVKYSDSVNPANNYARSRQWTFGIEVMK